jgi:hypothetical protein
MQACDRRRRSSGRLAVHDRPDQSVFLCAHAWPALKLCPRRQMTIQVRLTT